MSYKIQYTPRAKRDYVVIIEYLAQFYPSTPQKFKDALKKGIRYIAEHPTRCPSYEYRPEFRKLNVNQYLVFYMIDEEEETIYIARIRHGKEDLEHNWE